VPTHGYAEPPFRIGRCFDEGPRGLHMIMVSSAPGLFGGDRFTQHVRVEEGAHVRLTSQSALQVHPSPDGAVAEVTATYEVAAGASLACEWDPMIPFAASRYRQSIELRVADGSALYWMDAFSSGRSARGERWHFHLLEQELRLMRQGSLDYLERYKLEPGTAGITSPWVAADAACFGTGLVSAPDVDREKADRLHDALQSAGGGHSASDLLDRNLLIVRMMSQSHVLFHGLRRQVAASLLPGR
jgi:urease accessory protein UreH